MRSGGRGRGAVLRRGGAGIAPAEEIGGRGRGFAERSESLWERIYGGFLVVWGILSLCRGNPSYFAFGGRAGQAAGSRSSGGRVAGTAAAALAAALSFAAGRERGAAARARASSWAAATPKRLRLST